MISQKAVERDAVYLCVCTESLSGSTAAPPNIVLIFSRSILSYSILGARNALESIEYDGNSNRLKFNYNKPTWPYVVIYKFASNQQSA